jgi:hypothetical protein
MYFDNKPCEVCGAEIELSPAASVEDTSAPDATIDTRTCTNPECPTRRAGQRTVEEP